MSIIEKALDKLEQRREHEARGRARSEERARVDRSVTRPVPPERRPEDPLDALAPEAPLLSPETAVAAPGSAADARPAETRRTVKHVEIDLERLAAAGIVTPDTHQSELVEQFRIVKRPLIAKAAQASAQRVPNGNLVLVTSALPGEGKTFTAINLAMSIVMELDHTALLVDTDVIKGDVSRMLGIEEEEGLGDYLADRRRDLADLLVKTSVDKLTVLPAGRHRANITELFASDEMRRLAGELSQRYADRVVVVDSPPLLSTSGATVLAGLAGQIVMVVEAIRTPQSALREALDILGPAHHVGLVLNKSRESGGRGYNYGQYHQKGSAAR